MSNEPAVVLTHEEKLSEQRPGFPRLFGAARGWRLPFSSDFGEKADGVAETLEGRTQPLLAWPTSFRQGAAARAAKPPASPKPARFPTQGRQALVQDQGRRDHHTGRPVKANQGGKLQGGRWMRRARPGPKKLNGWRPELDVSSSRLDSCLSLPSSW